MQFQAHILGAQSVFSKQINTSPLPMLSLVPAGTSDNGAAHTGLSSDYLVWHDTPPAKVSDFNNPII